MRCGQAERLMAQEFDQPLPPEQAERLAAHLARCARCRAVQTALHEADDLLGQQARPVPGPDLAERVLARLPRDRRAVLPRAPAWTRASSIVAVALCLVLLAAGAVVLLTGAAVGYGDWSIVQESGRSLIGVAWDSLRDFSAALGTTVAALWQALRWPWALIGAGGVLVIAAVWGWLWVRSRRWRL